MGRRLQPTGRDLAHIRGTTPYCQPAYLLVKDLSSLSTAEFRLTMENSRRRIQEPVGGQSATAGGRAKQPLDSPAIGARQLT
ncbi:hypothetical protein PCAR4_1340002 [Paraburkholderia caribensis]|nr:hypothetical protein PCAR4_1340002 [Paraburkholderia caribensis]